MHYYVLLIVGRQKSSPRNPLPRIRPVAEDEIGVENFAPVRWTACYVARNDTVGGPPALLIFSGIKGAATYATINLDGQDVEIVSASDEEIQKHAFGGDPDGLCIIDSEWTHPPGLSMRPVVSKLAEYEKISWETEGV